MSSELVGVEGHKDLPMTFLSGTAPLVILASDGDTILQPEEARRLAAMLVTAADFAEATDGPAA